MYYLSRLSKCFLIPSQLQTTHALPTVVVVKCVTAGYVQEGTTRMKRLKTVNILGHNVYLLYMLIATDCIHI